MGQLPSRRAVAVRTLGSLQDIPYRTSQSADGKTNLMGALRRGHGDHRLYRRKEFQRIEVVRSRPTTAHLRPRRPGRGRAARRESDGSGHGIGFSGRRPPQLRVLRIWTPALWSPLKGWWRPQPEAAASAGIEPQAEVVLVDRCRLGSRRHRRRARPGPRGARGKLRRSPVEAADDGHLAGAPRIGVQAALVPRNTEGARVRHPSDEQGRSRRWVAGRWPSGRASRWCPALVTTTVAFALGRQAAGAHSSGPW